MMTEKGAGGPILGPPYSAALCPMASFCQRGDLAAVVLALVFATAKYWCVCIGGWKVH